MTFLEYLTICRGIDSGSEGINGKLYRIARLAESNDYRDLSYQFAESGEVDAEVLFEMYWNEYEGVIDTERSLDQEPPRWINRGRGDTNVVHISKLKDGFNLWRCVNVAGVPYSFVTDPEGYEVASVERMRESEMMRSFIREHYPIVWR